MDDFLKMSWILATFLKIVRIFLNQDVLGYNLRREYVRRNKMRLIPNLEKSARKLENRHESALFLEKRGRFITRYPPTDGLEHA